ncbi:MAG TPA: pyridoxamine 5'-phosphate oxidase family protein [Burkholderiales bacterium]|nr:pyridoxamine 5'-phosphate oxidase family protein [Burkholderiales bacterium]
MSAAAGERQITTIEELEAMYATPAGPSLAKEIDHISEHYRAFIEKAPFVVVATSGPGGLDCSPRGDPAGFVRVLDRKRVLIPDRRGNNRLDSLRNLVEDPRVSLLFLIPGVSETLRINGRARILVDEELAASFAINERTPKVLIEVTADRVYFQCAKALVRSRLWASETQVPRSALPSTGQILAEITNGKIDAVEHDRGYPERVKQTIY